MRVKGSKVKEEGKVVIHRNVLAIFLLNFPLQGEFRSGTEPTRVVMVSSVFSTTQLTPSRRQELKYSAWTGQASTYRPGSVPASAS